MSASRSTLRILFLGCGRATRIHSRILRGSRDIELTYASRDSVRAAEYCATYGGAGSWGSYEEGLSDARVQIVVVATPTALHLELALAALGARRHVIVEKPAFMQSADVARVRAAAADAARQVFVAENYVYKPLARELRAVIGAGALGDVRFVLLNATRWQKADGWRAEPALSGGGALFEAGVHWISFASHIGLEVEALEGFPVGQAGGPDASSLVVLRYTNGAVCSLAHSWELRGTLRGARLSKVQGTRGSVTFESNGFVTLTTGRRRGIRLHLQDPLGYRTMLADFLGAVREGRPPYYTLDMVERDLQWLEGAQAGLGRD